MESSAMSNCAEMSSAGDPSDVSHRSPEISYRASTHIHSGATSRAMMGTGSSSDREGGTGSGTPTSGPAPPRDPAMAVRGRRTAAPCCYHRCCCCCCYCCRCCYRRLEREQTGRQTRRSRGRCRSGRRAVPHVSVLLLFSLVPPDRKARLRGGGAEARKEGTETGIVRTTASPTAQSSAPIPDRPPPPPPPPTCPCRRRAQARTTHAPSAGTAVVTDTASRAPAAAGGVPVTAAAGPRPVIIC
ncbi:hypothetical protein GGR56DRAFT_28417 [Xylariaceae sp. FL0804]|nr:hypothetical protein GGR56DRAFT_28417 [Xylariaceae sp. FL0804]